jgi:hypothetical protein
MTEYNPQAKIMRVFQLLSLICTREHTIESLSDAFDCNGRTIYRYIELLEELGFLVDSNARGEYFMNTDVLPECVQHFVDAALKDRNLPAKPAIVHDYSLDRLTWYVRQKKHAADTEGDRRFLTAIEEHLISANVMADRVAESLAGLPSNSISGSKNGGHNG